MKAIDLLDLLAARLSDTDTGFFYNEEDVCKSIGGYVICGEITENKSYLHTSTPLEDTKANAIVYYYGDLIYLYLIDDE